MDCLEVLEACFPKPSLSLGSFEESDGRALFDVWYVKEGIGEEGSDEVQALVSYLLTVLDQGEEDVKGTTLSVSRYRRVWGPDSVEMERGFPTRVLTLGRCEGGGLWRQSLSEGDFEVRMTIAGSACVGNVWGRNQGPVVLESGQCYSVEPWMGGDLLL